MKRLLAVSLLGLTLLLIAQSAAAETVVVPYGSEHRYNVYQSSGTPADWASPSFDDSGFPVGSAPFGSGGTCPIQSGVRTFWPVSSELLVRREFVLPAGASDVRIFVAVDNDVAIAVNGVDVSGGWLIHEGCATLDSFTISVPDSIIVVGTNLLAVLGRERGGNQSYLDVQVTRGGPTAVSVQSLAATRRAHGVLVRWRTAAEADIIGFNLFLDQNGRFIRLNPSLLPSVFGGTTIGHSYFWLDRRARRNGTLRYKLQAVSLAGTRRWVGVTSTP